MNAEQVASQKKIAIEQLGKRQSLALTDALTWGTISAIAVTGITLAAAKRFPKFDKWTSVSAKASFPAMAGLGIFNYRYETVSLESGTNPEKYGLLVLDPSQQHKKYSASKMPFHHRVMNSIYDHPFVLVTAMGVPLATKIISEQMKNKHLTFSQKMMQSRVFAQFGVLSILIVTMGFSEYMRKRGRFPEPEDGDYEEITEKGSDESYEAKALRN